METTTPPPAVSKAAYARQKGCNRATITRWAQGGRIVLDEDGNVLVAESEARLAETADPTKAGVVHRHSQERGGDLADLGSAPDVAPAKPSGKRSPKSEHYDNRVRESARKEAAEADLAEMRRDREIGKLTDVDGVMKAMADHGALTRQTYESIVPDLKLRVAVESDPDKCGQLLLEAIRAAATKVHDLMLAQLDAAASAKQ